MTATERQSFIVRPEARLESVVKRLTAFVAAVLIATPGAGIAHAQSSQSLPVGDGRVSARSLAGNVFACQTQFRTGGALHAGPWIDGDTWNPLEKPRVEGRIMWPNAAFSLTDQGQSQRAHGNGLPVGQPTGTFPITPDQPVYQYDTNPNRITTQTLDFNIPASPQRSASPQCLPMGMIGFTLTGVAFYNALDAAGLDAAAHEIQDLCDGHPQGRGQYHYHSASSCIPGAQSNEVVGWALDGYPIMGMVDASGATLVNADLDDCHGRAETVVVGERTYDYAYRLTREYPYVMGCFVGQVAEATNQAIRDGLAPRQNNNGGNRRRAGQRPGR